MCQARASSSCRARYGGDARARLLSTALRTRDGRLATHRLWGVPGALAVGSVRTRHRGGASNLGMRRVDARKDTRLWARGTGSKAARQRLLLQSFDLSQPRASF